MLEPVPKLSFGKPRDNRVIEGDNLQVMVSLRSQYQGAIDVAYLDPPYNTGKRDFAYSDARFHDPNADADDMTYVNNEDGGRHTKWLNYLGPRLWLVWHCSPSTASASSPSTTLSCSDSACSWMRSLASATASA